jgi:hypothetical protein
MVPEPQTVRPKYSIELADVLNCYVLIIWSKAAATIATFKPSSTRRSNAVSVDAIKAYEEVGREFHAFLTSAIHGEKWSCLKLGRFISEECVAVTQQIGPGVGLGVLEK